MNMNELFIKRIFSWTGAEGRMEGVKKMSECVMCCRHIYTIVIIIITNNNTRVWEKDP